MGDYLWVPYVVAAFVLIPVLAIGLERLFVRVFKGTTGRDKREAAEREVIRAHYENPDWRFYENHLGCAVPEAMRSVYESDAFQRSHIVRVDGEEYFLYPIFSEGLAVEGFYPLGQNELGAAIFLDKCSNGDSMPLFQYVTRDERIRLFDDSAEFFKKIVEQNGFAT